MEFGTYYWLAGKYALSLFNERALPQHVDSTSSQHMSWKIINHGGILTMEFDKHSFDSSSLEYLSENIS